MKLLLYLIPVGIAVYLGGTYALPLFAGRVAEDIHTLIGVHLIPSSQFQIQCSNGYVAPSSGAPIDSSSKDFQLHCVKKSKTALWTHMVRSLFSKEIEKEIKTSPSEYWVRFQGPQVISLGFVEPLFSSSFCEEVRERLKKRGFFTSSPTEANEVNCIEAPETAAFFPLFLLKIKVHF